MISSASNIRFGPLGASHALHASEAVWPASNCYTDMWIELLRWLGHDPVPGLAFTLACDWEGDQWTLHKFQPVDLYLLYGLDVTEINIWKPLLEHVAHHVTAKRPVLVEVDGYYLPDTVATTYHSTHEKTTIAVVELNLDAETAAYFHDAGGYTLTGNDLMSALHGQPNTSHLPPYVEIVKLTRRVPLEGEALTETAISLARLNVGRRPDHNPFVAFGESFGADLEWMTERGEDAFHQYAFTAIRQPGSAFQYAAEFLRWLDARAELGLDPVAADLSRLSGELKTLMLRTARAVVARRPLDFEERIARMAALWESTMDGLVTRIGDDTEILAIR